jgi:beta-N-acetylhexosaminidase
MRRILAVVAASSLLILAACAAEPAPSPTRTSSAPAPSPTRTGASDLALEQQVGQLFMVGTKTGTPNAAALAAVSKRHVGGIFLHSGVQTSVAQTAALVQQFTSLVSAETTGGVPLWVATDQEGGEVQVLTGPGFDAMPSAVEQGQLPIDQLAAKATTWGGQLQQAGVTMNLAPVADIVASPQAAPKNKPVGALDREYGYDEQTVSEKAGAFADGMRQAGVLPTFKHFPGLGKVHADTDFTANVVDTVIGPDSPDVQVYRDLLAGGTSAVMVSTTIYQKIDPSAPAAFSPKVVTQLLRGTLGFDGPVITDDLSAAAQVASWTPAERAILAIEAGCDVVLVSTDPTVVVEMYDAVLAKAKSDPQFAALVDQAAARVVKAKGGAGAGG